MKKYWLIIYILLSFCPAYAQSFSRALIVRSDGDSLSGFIRLDYSSRSIHFKIKDSSDIVRYSASDIRAFHVENLVYERNKIDDEQFFLQKLVLGSAILYRLNQNPFGKSRYFLRVGNAIEELTYNTEEVVMGNQRYQRSNQKFLHTFTQLLTDCSEFTNSAWGTAFTRNVLTKTVAAYNDCRERNGSGLKTVLYPVSIQLPVKFFMRLGISTMSIPPPDILETQLS